MPYKITITGFESGKHIPGEIDLYDDQGSVIGFFTVPAAGTEVTAEELGDFSYAVVQSPGYMSLMVRYIMDDSNFTLAKKKNVWLWAAGGAAAMLLVMKFAKVK